MLIEWLLRTLRCAILTKTHWLHTLYDAHLEDKQTEVQRARECCHGAQAIENYREAGTS